MATTDLTGIRRLIKASGYSWQGLKAAVANEPAFKQEILLAIICIPLGLYLGDNGVQQALLVIVILLILIVELLHSGIEAVVDRIGTEHHQLAGRAKDLGSAAVLLSLINAAIVWGLVLLN